MSINEELARRLSSYTSFPSLPAVAAEITELAQDPDIEIRQVAQAVSHDPALAAKVLRIANSALYAQRRRSTNLRQALIVLGLNATLTLALSFTLVNTLRKNPPDGFDHRMFWRRALLSATWGKLLATEIGRADSEEVFLSCLLQDIGMMALDKAMPEVYEGASEIGASHDELRQMELDRVRNDHADVGGWLLQKWNIPEQIRKAVELSHEPESKAVHPDYRSFIRCVGLSGMLADAWSVEAPPTAIKRIAEKARFLLGVDHVQLGKMFETISEQLPVTEDLFEMRLFKPDAAEEILERAREILVLRNLQVISEVSELRETTQSLEEQNKELREEGRRDALTGLYNRLALEEALEREFKDACENEWPLSVIFVDLDDFKQVNDTHGHHAGDRLLRETATVLRKSTRDSDIVARFGGDEFVVLLPGTDSGSASTVCQRIVKTMSASDHVINGEEIGITTSLGVATRDSAHQFDTVAELLDGADQALYRAKSGGRNQFATYSDAADQKTA